jgi:signal transduction histidine kinase
LLRHAIGLRRDGKPRGARFGGAVAVAAFSCFVVAAIWIAITVYCIHERATTFDDARRELLGAENVVRAHVGRTYDSARNTLLMVDDWLSSRSTGWPPASLDELEKLVLSMQKHDEQPITVGLTNAADYVFRSIPPRDRQIYAYVGDRAYTKALRDAPEGTLYINPPVVSRVDGLHSLPMAIRTHPNGYGVKTIAAVMKETTFTNAYDNLLTLAPGRIGLVKLDGTLLLVWSDDDDPQNDNMTQFAAAIAQQPSENAGILTLPAPDADGDALVAFARVSSEPLAVFATFDEADIRRVWLRRIALPLELAAISTLIVMIFTFWMTRLLRNREQESRKLVAALLKAEAANAAKKHFLASMSHELRTPLNAIIGFSEVMSTEALGPVGNPIYRGYATDIHGAGRHLLGIIKDILDIAKIDAGTIALGDEVVDPRKAVEECLKMLSEKQVEKQHTIDCTIPEATPGIRIDPVHLNQVLINIIGNAVKFTPVGGRIAVSAQPGIEGDLDIAIADSGIGIPKAQIGALFQPFSRVESSLYRNHEGIGLGLAHTRMVVEAYGGRVTLASEEGEGTTVTIRIPKMRLAALPAAEAKAA